MSIVEEIRKNLVDPDKHSHILKALVDILEEQGEKGVKDQIKRWIKEIKAETQSPTESEE
jgi:hypothetical protein